MAVNKKIEIKGMVMTALFTMLALLAAGLLIGLLWFSKGSERRFDAAEWNMYFMIFYIIGCLVSFGITSLAAVLGRSSRMNKRENWKMWTLVTIAIGLVFAAVLHIFERNGNVAVIVVSSLLFALEGFLIFFMGSLKAPTSWVYNPLA